jgi:putative intracellular protease/amidase
LHLIGPAEAFAAAALDDGYGGRIPCYEVEIVGATSERFHAESGVAFTGEADLQHAGEFDTVVIAGGSGIQCGNVAQTIADWILDRAGSFRRIGTVCTGSMASLPLACSMGAEVTVHWRAATDLARRFPQLKIDHKKPLVRAGACYTSSGLSAGNQSLAAMIRDDYGPHVAQAVSRDLWLMPAAPDRQESPTALASDSNPTDRFADLVAWIVGISTLISQSKRLRGAPAFVRATSARRSRASSANCRRNLSKTFGSMRRDVVSSNRKRRCKALRRLWVTRIPALSSARFQKRFGTRPAGFMEQRQKVAATGNVACTSTML